MSESVAKRVGSYELGKKVGGGGQAHVHEARCLVDNPRVPPNRPVALKIIRYHDSHPSADARFLERAKRFQQLEHPNIVQYYDAFIVYDDFGDQLRCIVMELLEGEDLRAYLKRNAHGLRYDEATRIFRQCLDGLGYATAHGIVHRDVTPSNIFLLANGTVKIIDFEIARQTEGTTTTAWGLKGKYAYLAPDFILMGDRFHGDETSDVFSLGVCFYEALTGKHPYLSSKDGGHIQYMRVFREGHAVEPELGVKSLRTLDQTGHRFLRKALSIQREHRYQSFAQMAEGLGQVRGRCIEIGGQTYEFVENLGKGGFGEVFLARRHSDERAVAVKHLFPSQDPDRFRREARILREHKHPNIVQYEDFGTVERLGRDDHYLVMEYLAGMPDRSLRTRLRKEGALSPAEVLVLFTGYIEALDFLHRAPDGGIVHRDITPANLYAPPPQARRDEGALPKLFDLGIARTEESVTQGQVPGSPEYMAPEFILESGFRGSVRSDIYNLGLCLYEALTGKHAYERLPKDTQAMWRTIEERARGHVSVSFNHHVFKENPQLGAVVQRAIHLDPETRYASAADLLRALKAAIGVDLAGEVRYQLGAALYEHGSCVYQAGRRIADGIPVGIIRKVGMRMQWDEQAFSRLRTTPHEALVRYLDVAFSDEYPHDAFLVVEHLPDLATCNLQCRLDGGNLPEPTSLLRSFGYVLEAVAALHASGRFLGGLRPRDLYIPPAVSQRPRVLNWGFSPDCRQVAVSERGFLAPELRAADDPRPTVQSDLFAIGACLWEALRGDAPTLVHGQGVEDVAFTTPLPPSGHFPALTEVMDHALHAIADQRYASAAEMAHDLQRCLSQVEAEAEDAAAAVTCVLSDERTAVGSVTSSTQFGRVPPAVEEATQPSPATVEDLAPSERGTGRREESISVENEEYRLHRVIGRGGFGEVYEAQRLRDGVTVAVKRLFPSREIKRFEREARILRDYPHANMVRYEAFGEMPRIGGADYYLVMEFLTGLPKWSLRSRCRGNALALDEAKELFTGYLEALGHLHGARPKAILHRDITPSNLYAPPPQERASRGLLPKLFDLGIARVEGSGALDTISGGRLPGTPDYMAPELILGEGNTRGSPATDIYSMGLCLYEALTGAPAYERLPDSGAMIEVVKQRQRGRIVPTYEHPIFREHPDLARVVKKAIAPQAHARYQTAAAFLAELIAVKDRVGTRRALRPFLLRAAAAVAIAAGVGIASAWLWPVVRPLSLPRLPAVAISTTYLDAIRASIRAVASMPVTSGNLHARRYRRQLADSGHAFVSGFGNQTEQAIAATNVQELQRLIDVWRSADDLTEFLGISTNTYQQQLTETERKALSALLGRELALRVKQSLDRLTSATVPGDLEALRPTLETLLPDLPSDEAANLRRAVSDCLGRVSSAQMSNALSLYRAAWTEGALTTASNAHTTALQSLSAVPPSWLMPPASEWRATLAQSAADAASRVKGEVDLARRIQALPAADMGNYREVVRALASMGRPSSAVGPAREAWWDAITPLRSAIQDAIERSPAGETNTMLVAQLEALAALLNSADAAVVLPDGDLRDLAGRVQNRLKAVRAMLAERQRNQVVAAIRAVSDTSPPDEVFAALNVVRATYTGPNWEDVWPHPTVQECWLQSVERLAARLEKLIQQNLPIEERGQRLGIVRRILQDPGAETVFGTYRKELSAAQGRAGAEARLEVRNVSPLAVHLQIDEDTYTMAAGTTDWFPVPPGRDCTITADVVDIGYEPQTRRARVPAGEGAALTVGPFATRAREIRVRMESPDDGPQPPELSVASEQSASSEALVLPAAVRAGRGWAFTFTAVPPVQYAVTAKCPDYRPLSFTVAVERGTTAITTNVAVIADWSPTPELKRLNDSVLALKTGRVQDADRLLQHLQRESFKGPLHQQKFSQTKKGIALQFATLGCQHADAAGRLCRDGRYGEAALSFSNAAAAFRDAGTDISALGANIAALNQESCLFIQEWRAGGEKLTRASRDIAMRMSAVPVTGLDSEIAKVSRMAWSVVSLIDQKRIQMAQVEGGFIAETLEAGLPFPLPADLAIKPEGVVE